MPGIVNIVNHEVTGLQVGLVNKAGMLRGVQIGLFNFASQGGILPAAPILNAGF